MRRESRSESIQVAGSGFGVQEETKAARFIEPAGLIRRTWRYVLLPRKVPAKDVRLIGSVFGLADSLTRFDDEQLVVEVEMASIELFAAQVDIDVDRLKKPQSDMSRSEGNQAVVQRLMLKIEEQFLNWVKKIGFQVNHLKCGRIDPSSPLAIWHGTPAYLLNFQQ